MPERDINYIVIRPGEFGWNLWIYPDDLADPAPIVYGIADAMQFDSEVDRTLGKWLADGPADFHGSISVRNSWGPNWEPITTTDEED